MKCSSSNFDAMGGVYLIPNTCRECFCRNELVEGFCTDITCIMEKCFEHDVVQRCCPKDCTFKDIEKNNTALKAHKIQQTTFMLFVFVVFFILVLMFRMRRRGFCLDLFNPYQNRATTLATVNNNNNLDNFDDLENIRSNPNTRIRGDFLFANTMLEQLFTNRHFINNVNLPSNRNYANQNANLTLPPSYDTVVKKEEEEEEEEDDLPPRYDDLPPSYNDTNTEGRSTASLDPNPCPSSSAPVPSTSSSSSSNSLPDHQSISSTTNTTTINNIITINTFTTNIPTTTTKTTFSSNNNSSSSSSSSTTNTQIPIVTCQQSSSLSDIDSTNISNSNNNNNNN